MNDEPTDGEYGRSAPGGRNVPLCSFGGDASLFAATPVENLFLQEMMLQAPGDYVKVYLYGLMQAHYPALAEKDMDKFSASLGMERGEVDKALAYWQKRELISVEKNGGLRFNNVRSALFGSRMAASEDGLYEFAAFSNRLEEIALEFGRPWKKKEPSTLYDLLDDGFEEDALFLLLRDALRRFGKSMASVRLNGLMQEWRQKNLRSTAAAREEILGTTLRNSPANEVLVKIGITQRKVSEAEHQLYEKWTGEWGFSQAAIFTAVQDMTGVQSPNFKYLDKKLSSLRKLEDNSAQGIAALKQRREQEDDRIRAFAYALGARGSVTDSWRRYYHRWTTEYGISQEMLLELAADLNAQGVNTFKEAESRVATAARQGLQRPEDLQKRQAVERTAQRMRERMGLSGQASPNECDNVARWLEKMPEEVLLYAADCSADARKPLGYAARILGDWQRGGVDSLAAAQAERGRALDASGQSSGGEAKATTYKGQRQYGGERDALFEDLEE